MGYKIILSLRAQRDLREIKRYISFDAAERAERFGQRLLAKTKNLELHPQMGRAFSEVNDFTIREIIVGSYRVIYEVNFSKKQVEILRYWHAARGAPNIHF